METISDSTGICGSVESLIGGRSENQDSYGMAETRIGMLVVVCDGMGGGPAGKLASTIAVRAIIDYVSGASENKSPVSVLQDAAVSANESILAAVEKDPSLKGMGTTCVCVLIRKQEAFVMHVGDSRCYLLHGNKSVFRTADHSHVGELVRRGSMTEEEARQSPYSNVITRALGGGIEIDPEIDSIVFHKGDRFALMSDGIWGSMPESELIGMLTLNEDPATLVPALAAAVDNIGIRNGGGHDNLTIALVDTSVERYDNKADYSIEEGKVKNKSKSRLLILILLGLLGIAIVVIAYLLIFGTPEKAKNEVSRNSKESISFTEPASQVSKDTSIPLEINKDDLRRVCLEAETIMESVKKYKPTSKDPSVAEVEGKREVMLKQAVYVLEKYAESLPPGNLKNTVSASANDIRGDIHLMKRVDSKWCHSRKDSNEAIDANIKRVKQLLK